MTDQWLMDASNYWLDGVPSKGVDMERKMGGEIGGATAKQWSF